MGMMKTPWAQQASDLFHHRFGTTGRMSEGEWLTLLESYSLNYLQQETHFREECGRHGYVLRVRFVPLLRKLAEDHERFKDPQEVDE